MQQGNVALFLDFDGTLVGIADRPDAICVSDKLSRQLEQLAARMAGRLAVVSGRSLDDLATYLGAPAIYRAGSHGAAMVGPDQAMIGTPPDPVPAEIVAALARFAAEQDLHLETKSHGVAVHYRSHPGRQAVTEEFTASLAREAGLEIQSGKFVVELVRPGGGKAGAVQALMQQGVFSGAMPVFIGDDITDEDGFAASLALGGFGIAVGERVSALAHYHLNSIRDVHEWLNL